MKTTEILARCEYFKGLSETGRTILAQVCCPETVARREILFMEGAKGRSCFVLAGGAIQLVKTSGAGREVVIRTVEPGEIFAEVVLFEQDAYPVTAVALRRSEVLRIPREEFRRLLGDAAFRTEFVAGLMRKLRYLTARILTLTSCEVDERFFLFLAEQYGRREEYTIQLRKKELAAAIGVTPETLSRLLLRLRRQGRITWKGPILRLKPGFWEKFEG